VWAHTVSIFRNEDRVVVCPSQFEISDAARMIHPGKRGHRIVAVLQFKFDESYDSQIMTVGGWIGEELEWKRLESTWQKRVEFENLHSPDNQKITRYHATEMNCKGGEYKNWDKERCLLFSQKLIHMLSKRRMAALAVACDMDAIREVFPKGDPAELKRRIYTLCFKALMVDIAHIMQTYFRGDTVVLIHDKNWSTETLAAYNLMIEEAGRDPDRVWGKRALFEGLFVKTGQDAIGLQAADMFAYETFKGVKAKTNNPEAAMRGAAQEMLNKQIPMVARWINLPSAKAMYRIMEESGMYSDLDSKGIC